MSSGIIALLGITAYTFIFAVTIQIFWGRASRRAGFDEDEDGALLVIAAIFWPIAWIVVLARALGRWLEATF